MNLDALTNRGEYLSAHYLADVLPGSLKNGVLKEWNDEERHDKETPRTRLRALRRNYLARKGELIELDPESPKHTETVQALHREILTGLGFTSLDAPSEPVELVVERAGEEHRVPVLHHEPGIVVIESGWAVDADAAADPESAGRLIESVIMDPAKPMQTASALASYLLLGEVQPPRYVVIVSGAVVILADRLAWFEGRYLAVSLDVAFGRNDTTAGGELDAIAALFAAEALRPPPEGGTELLATLRDSSRQHAVGVSSELREGLRLSVELIANEVLHRLREHGVAPEQIMEPAEMGKELARQSLRYLYRILFLLYAEARPELGVLPVDDRDYMDGYSLARLGEIASRRLIGEQAERRFHFYESLNLLFRMVNLGHYPRGPMPVGEKESEGEGIRFELLKSDLFLPEKTRLIGSVVHPDYDEDEPSAPRIDTRLRNACLHQVLRLLMIARGKRKGRGGFISYAQLGINQLGAVYEGLMSYTGFIAAEELFEVAKKGDPKDGSWMIPASKVDEYPHEVFVERADEETGVRSRVRYAKGSFVYRLAGRDRQTSASYYTPQSLTEVTVQLALRYRLEEEGREIAARELLDWTICEPALGSGAFINEAINQVAAEYLRRAQKERGETLDPERYAMELQRTKAYIALHNCYGVDLNRTAVELAEVSLWLNTMHPGLQAPWFGLHLRRGNSLIGAGRKTYTPEQLADKSWIKTAPTGYKLRDGDLPDGVIHHFLLPAEGWGAVASNPEARSLAPEDAKRLGDWRRTMLKPPTTRKPKGSRPSQLERLQAVSRRVEFLWTLVLRRLEISEREIRRDIKVWGADDLPPVPAEAVLRDKIVRDLESPGTPYWRLKTVMDTWCALWFWPLDQASILDSSAPEYATAPRVEQVVEEPAHELIYAEQTEFDLGLDHQPALPMIGKPTGNRPRMRAITLRPLVPLANVDDWIEFAEALLGRHDIPPDSLHAQFETLTEIEAFEDSLAALMAMDSESGLADRFPWLTVANGIAEDQGFFHWDLTFGHAFASGGFDLQVGNPPWVRPTWQEDVVLAERDPWFVLTDNPPPSVWQERKALTATVDSYFAGEMTINAGHVAYYSAAGTYPLLVGTQPDLYRAFMSRTWSNLSSHGVAGLIHPDSHLSGAREGRLRSATYDHLRLHGHFQNMRLIFPEVNWRQEFGLHIYGPPRDTISFTHVSWLYAPETLVLSLDHDGTGPLPGMKAEGTWDLRPHRSRLVRVDRETLGEWRQVTGEHETPVERTRLLHPVTIGEQGAISALAKVRRRLGEKRPMISAGFHEKGAKDDGIIVWDSSDPRDWTEVVLQGPHFGVATPLAKHPNIPCRSNKDYEPWDLTSVPDDAVPRTNYRRATDRASFQKAQDVWRGHHYTEYFRLAWREMVPLTTERSLFAAIIPPGPTHIHAVRSMSIGTNRETALNAAFWASLPLDYLLRITGRGHLDVNIAVTMPVAEVDHPLASAALLRVLRLNCLTRAFAPLWDELYDARWRHQDAWAVNWSDLPEASNIADVDQTWTTRVPLRSERARRSALVELDAIVAVWLGIAEEELRSMYERFAVLNEYESAMWFDSRGRRITRDYYARGVKQPNEAYDQLMKHLDETGPVPDGYAVPFHKADREREYREAHTVFSQRLQDSTDAGWTPS